MPRGSGPSRIVMPTPRGRSTVSPSKAAHSATKGRKRAAETTEESGGDGSDRSDHNIVSRKNQRKKPRTRNTGGAEETAGTAASKPRGKGKQREVIEEEPVEVMEPDEIEELDEPEDEVSDTHRRY